MSEVLVTLHTQFGKNFNKIDGSLKAKVYDLMAKLVADIDLTGLNYESIKNAGDRRIRTARVDLNHRAVLFEVNTAGIRQIFLANVLPHDEAYAWAAKATLKVNPASGALELRVIEPAADPTTRAEREGPATADADADAADERPCLLPFSVAELVDLGIDGPAAAAAVTVRDENDLLTLASGLAAWQGTALLDLYTGKSLDDVRSDHQITPVDAETADTDEAIIAAARRPSSQMEFAVMTDDAELRRVLDGDFAAWRLFLHPTQRAVAYRPSYNGPFRLTGGAGTGKTVVAIHRAVELARRRPDARVLLCTYNRTLAEQLKEDVLSLAGGEVGAAISVLGVDQLARTVTSRLGGGLVPNPLGDLDDEKVWQDARDAVGVGLGWSSRFFKDEYEHVILANRVTTSDDYLKVARRGRGVRLTRADRIDVWTVVDRYRSIMAANNRTTFQELTVEATDLLRQNSGQMTYDHVVVDEGQDLKPASWLMLRELVAPGPDDLFICADAHQRLYGQRLVLSRLGIETRGRSRKLTLNYRTTAQILHTALGVLHGDRVLDMEGDEESISGYRSVLAGGEPRLVGVRSQSDEVDTIIEAIRAWTSPDTDGSAPASGEIGVLTRRRRDAEQLATRLRGAGLNARFIEQSVHDVDDPIHVMTMHRAKGQEFRRVVVAHATRARLPEPNALKAVPPEDQDDVRARERFLLYVACTRARDELLVTWNGEPSEFLTDVIGRA